MIQVEEKVFICTRGKITKIMKVHQPALQEKGDSGKVRRQCYDLYLSLKGRRLAGDGEELSGKYPGIRIRAKAFDLAVKEAGTAIGNGYWKEKIVRTSW